MANLVCTDAAEVLKLSKGKRRILLEELGPSPINRFGDPTSGQHCLALIEKIIKEHGFAEYRYVAGWCHEPDPAAVMAVYNHSQNMVVNDPLLPKLQCKPLMGVFRKTHLMTALQMQKQGDKTFRGSQELLTAALGNQAMKETLEQGLYMEVCAYVLDLLLRNFCHMYSVHVKHVCMISETSNAHECKFS